MPARSTRTRLPPSAPPSSLKVIEKIVCERDERAFIFIAATTLYNDERA